MRVVQVSALGQTATGWAVLRRPDISEHSLSVAMWQENKGSVLTGITVCLAVLKDLWEDHDSKGLGNVLLYNVFLFPSLLPSFFSSSYLFLSFWFIHRFIYSRSVFSALGTVLNAGENSSEQTLWPQMGDKVDNEIRPPPFKMLTAQAQSFQVLWALRGEPSDSVIGEEMWSARASEKWHLRWGLKNRQRWPK